MSTLSLSLSDRRCVYCAAILVISVNALLLLIYHIQVIIYMIQFLLCICWCVVLFSYPLWWLGLINDVLLFRLFYYIIIIIIIIIFF